MHEIFKKTLAGITLDKKNKELMLSRIEAISEKYVQLEVENQQLKKKLEKTKTLSTNTQPPAHSNDTPNKTLTTILKDILKTSQDKNTALLHLKLDNFKPITDAIGNVSSQKLLISIQNKLQNALPEISSAASLIYTQHDKYIILIQQTRPFKTLNKTIPRILEIFHKPFEINHSSIYVRASIGASVYKENATSNADMLIHHSELALHEAHNNGKFRFEMYNKGMSSRSSNDMEICNTLHTALDNNSFFLVYQPKFDLRSNTFKGAEALIRWKKNGTIISPGDFLPQAEKTGLITPISFWVLRSVCKQIYTWQLQNYPVQTISINISPTYFEFGNLLLDLKKCLIEFPISAQLLELEITENSFICHNEESLHKIKAIQEIGCSISIDDFGTGYSSYSNLKHLPIDTIKIDRTLIIDISSSHKDELILKSIITLAKTMQLRIVAEGVEDQDTVNTLIKNNCDAIQGFFYSRPLTAEKYIHFLLINHSSLTP
jgi:diguanylate cyclase (GGDEF)-like protein